MYILEDAPECPRCGCEAEVVHYFRYTDTKQRCGFQCTCGAVVVQGILQGATLNY